MKHANGYGSKSVRFETEDSVNAEDMKAADFGLRTREMEDAIEKHRASKKDIPDCPCWGNAAQWVDAELYAVLDGKPEQILPESRTETLERAIRRHQEDMKDTPDCTCWITRALSINAELYRVLKPR